MAGDRRIERVDGELTRKDGSRLRVRLMLEIVSLPGEPSESTVSKCELLTRNVPDGEYELEYIYRGRFRAPVRVQHGVLVARGI